MYWMDELAAVAGSRIPVSFDEAIKRSTDGERLVFISPTIELSEWNFHARRGLLPKEMIDKVQRRRIYLKNGAQLQFLTDSEIEHGALRGIGKVVWVA